MSKRATQFWHNLILFRRSLIYQTKEFFQNSTLHGVRYIAESGRPIGEKFMWFCFVAIGTVTALVIIMSLWEKFQTNPTITGLDTDFYNQQVMFPSTVVCPEAPYDETKLKDLAFKTLGQYDHDDAELIEPFLKLLTKLSFENIEEALAMSLNFTPSVKQEMSNKNLRSLVFQIQISCPDTLKLCKYRDEEVNCSSHFDPVYTEHGFCYAFNSRFKSRVDADEKTLVIHDLYETDKKWALFFIPKSASEIFIFSHQEYFGWDFKPQLFWETNQAAEILISKKNTYTTDDARQLSIGQRKCIFADEIKLAYFTQEYTFSSCMKECRMNKALQFCKCLPPFFKPIASAPSCKIGDFPCLAKYKTNITNIKDCLQCELSCSKTVYNVEKLNKIFDKEGQHSINVEFLTWPIIRYKREVLFGWVDLLVSFGGIAGLFLGFSLLSGVEIIYYFTMRACCMVYRNREELTAIEEEIRKKPPPHIDMSLKVGNTHSKGRSLSLPPPTSRGKFLTNGGLILPPADGVRKHFGRRRHQKIFNRNLYKQIKVAPANNNLYRSSSEPPEYNYLP